MDKYKIIIFVSEKYIFTEPYPLQLQLILFNLVPNLN